MAKYTGHTAGLAWWHIERAKGIRLCQSCKEGAEAHYWGSDPSSHYQPAEAEDDSPFCQDHRLLANPYDHMEIYNA